MRLAPLLRLGDLESDLLLFARIKTSWYSRQLVQNTLPQSLLVMVDNMSLADRKTHPLIKPLCERLKSWRDEVGLITHPHLQESLEDALRDAKSAGVEPDLVIFVIAICEWWFRVCLPGKNKLGQILKHRLNDPRYTPYPRFATDVFKTRGVPLAINEHVDRHLRKSWESETSKEMNQVFRERLLGKSKKLMQELANPFLVSEYRWLPPKCGGYPDWGPWVAATVVYRSAILHSPTERDSKPLRSAEAVIGVLRGKCPDKSAFHRKRQEIGDRVPKLVKAIMEAYGRAKSMHVQDKRVLPLIDADCFPSLWPRGGSSLILGKAGSIERTKCPA